VGVKGRKWRKHLEKWPENEKRRERSLSAFGRLVLGLVVPQNNKKLPSQGSNLQPAGKHRFGFIRKRPKVDLNGQVTQDFLWRVRSGIPEVPAAVAR
jgi:hypothetical protein